TPVTGTVKVEGKAIPVPGAPPSGGPVQRLTDDYGKAEFRFLLPKDMKKGDAEIVIQQHDGLKDALAKQIIPGVTPQLTVDFYPEGGELVAGVPSRVYYRVRTPLGQPAAPEGHVVLWSSKTGPVVDLPRDQGIGVFTFAPEAGDQYYARVSWPKA